MLGLVAVGAVEIATEAGDDRQSTPIRISSARLVATLQELELVQTVGDEHSPEDEVTQHRSIRCQGGLASCEVLCVLQIFLAEAEERSAHAVVDEPPRVGLDAHVVTRESQASGPGSQLSKLVQ